MLRALHSKFRSMEKNMTGSRISGVYQDGKVSVVDAGGEVSTMTFSSTVITDANIDAQTALFDAFVDSVETLILGNVTKVEWVNTEIFPNIRPTNGAARETKLLVQYQNTQTGKRYAMTIPTLNPVLPVYSDNINAIDVVLTTTPAAITGFIAAFNAFVKDPSVPLALVGDIAPHVTVVGLKVVGRNI